MVGAHIPAARLHPQRSEGALEHEGVGVDHAIAATIALRLSKQSPDDFRRGARLGQYRADGQCASSLGWAPEFSSRPISFAIWAMAVRGIILDFSRDSPATLRHGATMHSCCCAAGLDCGSPQASASPADPGQLESVTSPARSCSLQAKRQQAGS